MASWHQVDGADNADSAYARLVSSEPPSVDKRSRSCSMMLLSDLLVGLVLVTVIAALLIFVLSGQDKDLPGDARVKIPTISRLGVDYPSAFVSSAGFHISSLLCLGVSVSLLLVHQQRLSASTGVERVDASRSSARVAAHLSFLFGILFAAFWCLAGSVPPSTSSYSKGGESSMGSQDRAHNIIAGCAVLCWLLFASLMSFGVLIRARGIFIVSPSDKFWLRCKLTCLGLICASLLIGYITILIQQRWLSDGRDCATEWCVSKSIQAVFEYFVFILGLAFMFSLRHDLQNATLAIGTDVIVL